MPRSALPGDVGKLRERLRVPAVRFERRGPQTRDRRVSVNLQLRFAVWCSSLGLKLAPVAFVESIRLSRKFVTRGSWGKEVQLKGS